MWLLRLSRFIFVDENDVEGHEWEEPDRLVEFVDELWESEL